MRGIVIAFLLLFSLSAQGQFIIDSYRFGGAAAPLLDDYPNAAAAYSLRLLRTAYTGDAIVVRRSSNNDTLAIGFSGGVLDTAAMKTFCGTGATDTCFVRRWYDQSGNNKTAVQETNANQPQILTNGVVVRNDGNVAINFNNTTNVLVIANSDTLSSTFYFMVTKLRASSGFSYIFSNATTFSNTRHSLAKQQSSGADANKRYVWNGAAAFLDGVNSLNTELASLYYPSTNPYVELWVNSASQTFSTTPSVALTATGQINLGVLAGNINFMDGWFNEFIIYNSDQSTNRTAIETNINNFYLIY